MKARKTLAAAALVCLAAVSVWAYQRETQIWGNNAPGVGTEIGLWAEAKIDDTDNPTYIKVRVEGFYAGNWGVSCERGFKDGGYCADNAHEETWGDEYYSKARMRVNVVPYGCYQATSHAWKDDSGYLGPHYDATCFNDPPPPPPSEEDQCLASGGYWDPYTGCIESPIVIATGQSRAYVLTSAADGVYFDLNGDGTLRKVAWTKPGAEVAFLALDRNGNGVIDNGSELFGNRTVAGASNGFEALRQLSGDLTGGVLDSADSFFASLLLWTDANHNGISEPAELEPAASVLEAIGLGYTVSNRRDGHGNVFKFEGWARLKAAGSVGASNIVWGTRTQDDNIVWGTRAQQFDPTEASRERAIYDVYFAVQ